MTAAVASPRGGHALSAERFRTRVRDGLLGDFSFHARGDIPVSPITILRVGGGRSSPRIQSIEGGTAERVVPPRPRRTTLTAVQPSPWHWFAVASMRLDRHRADCRWGRSTSVFLTVRSLSQCAPCSSEHASRETPVCCPGRTAASGAGRPDRRVAVALGAARPVALLRLLGRAGEGLADPRTEVLAGSAIRDAHDKAANGSVLVLGKDDICDRANLGVGANATELLHEAGQQPL
jgi:hypothetical protein